MGRLKLFIPLAIFAVMAALFFTMIQRIGEGEYNPQALPSALLNKQIPAFALPSLTDVSVTLRQQDLLGEIALINVWATWCPSCHAEHDYLLELQRRGVAIFGINYKDDISAAQQWLQKKGDPYRSTIVDVKGGLGLDFGVTGAPETYLIDHRGFVRMRYQGPLDERVWQEKFAPLMAQLRLEQQGDEG